MEWISDSFDRYVSKYKYRALLYNLFLNNDMFLIYLVDKEKKNEKVE